MTQRERDAFRTGADFADLCAVSRSVTQFEQDRARYDEIEWDLWFDLHAGRITPAEYATRIAAAVRECGR